MILKGKVHKYGDNVDTDVIIPARYLNTSVPAELAAHCMEDIDADFVKKVQPGDILVAGRNFGCSSGRALAAKALKATGVSVIVTEMFSRTFYRNGAEIGLPLLEAPGIHDLVDAGDRLRADITSGLVENLTSGKSLRGKPLPEFLLEMVRAGGLIPLLKSGSKFFGVTA